MLNRLAIIGRGAPALDVINAVGDLPADRKVHVVVLHVTEDRRTRFVRAADDALDLGPVSALPTSNPDTLRRALAEAGADGVWSEDDDCVAAVCRTLGLPLFEGQAELRTAVGLATAAPDVTAVNALVRLVDLEGTATPRRVRMLELPGGPGIEVTAGVSQGDEVCASGSPVLVRVTAYGDSASQAEARLRRALAATTVVVDGATTTKGEPAKGELSRVGLIVAAVEAHTRAVAEEVANFLDTATRGLPALGPDGGHTFHLGLDAITYRVHVLQRTQSVYRIAEAEVQVERLDDFRRRVTFDGASVTVVTSAHAGFELVELDGRSVRVEHRDGTILRSPVPALVVQQSVAEGKRVAAGTALAVLESMKLESVIRAPFDCEVGEWLVRPGAQVAYGAPLVRVVAQAHSADADDVLRGSAPLLTQYDELLAQILGYDADDAITSARLATYRVTSEASPDTEVSLLTAYADVDDLIVDTYLRSRSVTDAPLPERAARWYGAAELSEVLLRVCRAHRRHDSIPEAVLQRWLYAPALDTARSLLDRLVEPCRSPQIRNLALAVRHQWYERTPAVDRPVARVDPRRLELFQIKRLPSDVLLYDARAAGNPADRRLVAVAEGKHQLEQVVRDCMAAVRIARISGPAKPVRIHLWIHGAVPEAIEQLAPLVDDPDLEELVLYGDPGRRLTFDPLSRLPVVSNAPAPDEPLRPFGADELKLRQASSRGYPTPHHLAAFLAGPGGSFTELGLDDDGALVAVAPRGTAGIVVGLVTTITPAYPEGMTRVLLCGDPTRALGAVAEPECRRIIAAIDLAARLGVPVEWFALSSGARISMDSGTENMDWVAAALRRIVTFTQSGGEINVVAAGINVGAQPYWNAEGTMLMHTRGVLIMTPQSAMVLTGKRSLDFSGAVSADNEAGIGGYERVMGPNGQGQYWAPNLAAAVGLLMRHYDHTYVAPGEPGPRRVPTSDPVQRDISDYPHAVDGCEFRTVGEIFSLDHNPERKKAFDIRTVMHAVIDQDSKPLERWADMADAQNAVVLDARLGGHAVCLLGVESRPTPRYGVVPADGPPVYSAATLFPQASKKLARAINAASGNRPLVVLANLAGFDGSPDSLRHLQLEYGAEIGRAVVNFRGPIVFCVVGRYHGGAFVVFSKRLNPRLTVLAVTGARASVIGGAPAANVVLAGEATRRARADERIAALEADLRSVTGPERLRVGLDLVDVRDSVQAQVLDELAHEFDRVHDVDRAVAVGSVDAVIPPDQLRPAVIAALEAGSVG